LHVLKIGAAAMALATLGACERADDRAAAAVLPTFNLALCPASLSSSVEIPVDGCVSSPSKAYVLIMGRQGALEIRPIRDGAPGPDIWTSGSLVPATHHANAVLQGDGNLVIYDQGKPIWNSETNGAGGIYRLQVTDQGEALLQNPAGATLWSSKSGKPPAA
jgi:hypothetical protein